MNTETSNMTIQIIPSELCDYDRQLAGITVAEVLAELATRPHLPNKLEGKKARQLASPAGRRKLKRLAKEKQTA